MAKAPSPERNNSPPTWITLGVIVLVSIFLSQFCRTTFSSNNRSNSGAKATIEKSDVLFQAEKGNIREIIIHSDGNVFGSFHDPVNGDTQFETYVVPHILENFDKLLLEKDPSIYIINRPAGVGFSNLLPFLFPILLILGFWIFFMRNMQGGTNKAMNFGKSKARLLKQDKKKVTFKDVAGIDEAKEELQEIVEFLRDPEKFQKLGGHIPKGVLLMGAPGTGKTLLAKAVAGEAGVPFLWISGSDFVEMFVGVGASRIRDLFNEGKKNSPCIIFMDELDAVGRHRGAGLGGGHDEREQTLNQLLVEMDGFESREGVILVAATNRPDVLDPALLRPGRFDRRVVVNKPDVKGRDEIFKIYISSIPIADDVDSSILARSTPGFVGADIKNLVNEAALYATRCNKEKVSMEEFEYAKDKVSMGAERRSMIISDEEKMITAVHEAGHAIMAVVTSGADPLHKVTIIPRGMALGVTQMLPEEDRHNLSETQLGAQIKVLLGGRIAEEVVLDEPTTGASNDLDRATDLVDKMVCEWGMSNLGLGLLQHAREESNPFLGRQFAQGKRNCSEATAKRIDEEKKRLIDEAYETVKRILTERREALDKVTERLITKGTISGDVVREIVKANEP